MSIQLVSNGSEGLWITNWMKCKYRFMEDINFLNILVISKQNINNPEKEKINLRFMKSLLKIKKSKILKENHLIHNQFSLIVFLLSFVFNKKTRT